MQTSRWLGRAIFLIILAAMLPLTALASSLAAPDQPGEVDAALWQTLVEGQSSDLVVEFAEKANLSTAHGIAWEARGDHVVDALRAVAERTQANAIAYLNRRGMAHHSFLVGNQLYVWEAGLKVAEHLASLPGVTRVRAPITLYLEPIIRDVPGPQAITDWGITDTKADQFWSAFGVQGSGIVVSNIDTGVQWDHPALVNQFKCPGDPSNPACWEDPSNICGGSACDNNGHGTHTMGTMVADDDPGLTYIAGMAPDAQWIACKGCESSSCSEFALNSCADWILAPGGSTANRPHVVNNSWGGGGGDTWYLSKVEAWRAAGIFPAFSAGNSGSSCSTLGSPGDYQESFASAAHQSNRTVASFSSRGPSAFGHDPYTKPNISAPGVSICSTVPTNSWSCGYSGTSMASPHTAGAVALLWSCNSSLVGLVDQAFQILQDSADTPPAGNCGAPPDAEGNYTYGYGYLNILQAGYDWCEGEPPPTPTPTNTPTPEPVEPILLVDDDAGSSYESYYTAALDALGKGYNVWNVLSQGSPSAAELQQHDIVIWFTGDDYTTTLTSTDESNLAAYLDGGGKLFITGQDIGYDVGSGAFYGNYLHASYVLDDTNTYGLTGYDILSGVNVNISGGDGANNQSYPSEIGLGSSAVGLFDYDGSYTWGGLRWEGAYKVVYFSFGYEAINASADRTSVMDAVLGWLEGVPPPPTPTPTPVPPTPTSTNTPTPEPTPTDTPTGVPPTPTDTPTVIPPTPTDTPTPTGVPPTPTPTPEPGVVFFDDFESDKGWVVNPDGSDTATTGMWERANPEGTSYGGLTYQLGTTASGSYDLVTGRLAGSSVGSYDIDNGDTTIRSPNIVLPTGEDITLSFYYYLAHYNNATSADYLRVKVVGATTTTVFEELGAGDYDEAAWATFSGSLNAFAGQTIYLLIEAADASGASLVEAAIDDVSITSGAVPPPTPTPTGEPPTPTPVPPTPTPTPTPGGW